MEDVTQSLFTTVARLATFQSEHRLEKRRASSQKKKAGNTASWPHKVPTPEDLSRAGFYYKPLPDSNDNVACFLCDVKLDGWEDGDIPLDEHLAHAKSCPWATSLSCSREGEDRDPMDIDLVEARTATYAGLWPHEKKKGWKPKLQKLVDAGWCYDPAEDAEDGVTCFYCNISLDGWEPKDVPMDEHRRRSPDCTFFALVERYGSLRISTKGKRGRASTASRASRLSTQSMQSAFSEAPSLMSLGDAGMHTDVDDSLAIDNTIASDVSTTKGRKKTTKPKGTAKGRKKAKKEESVEPSVIEQEYLEPPLEEEYVEPPVEEAPYVEPDMEVEHETEPVPELKPEPVQDPAKPTRGRKLKRADESHIEDASVMEVDPPAKTKKGRSKAKKVEKVETPPPRISEDESQLQAELQDAASFASALQSPALKAKKGTKRTSEGIEKVQELVEETIEEVPVKPKKVTKTTKGKKAKKTAKDVQEDSEIVPAAVDESIEVPQDTKPKRGRKPKKAQKEPEPKPELEPEPEPEAVAYEAENDIEMEHEQENDHILHLEPEIEPQVEPEEVQAEGLQDEDPIENAMQPEQEEIEEHEDLSPTAEEEEAEVNDEEDATAFETPHSVATSYLPTPAEEEFEPTPTPQKPRYASQIPSSVIPSSLRQQTPRAALESSPTASPQSSDAENHRPASSSSAILHPQSTIKKPKAAVSDFEEEEEDEDTPPAQQQPQQPALMGAIELFPSPVKTTKIPILPGTPTHHTRSPSKIQQMSPSKRLGTLKSNLPWDPVDLETIFFSSPQKDVGGLGVEERLAMAGGLLSKEEMGMSVEEWVRWRAEQGEGKLKGECERLVGLFEKEGGRAMDVLVGIETSS